MPAESSPRAARFSFSYICCCRAASSVKSTRQQIQPFHFFLLIAQFLNPALHGGAHEGGGVLRARCRRRFFFVRVSRVPKIVSHKEGQSRGDRKNSEGRAGTKRPQTRGLRCLQGR